MKKFLNLVKKTYFFFLEPFLLLSPFSSNLVLLGFERFSLIFFF